MDGWGVFLSEFLTCLSSSYEDRQVLGYIIGPAKPGSLFGSSKNLPLLVLTINMYIYIYYILYILYTHYIYIYIIYIMFGGVVARGRGVVCFSAEKYSLGETRLIISSFRHLGECLTFCANTQGTSPP